MFPKKTNLCSWSFNRTVTQLKKLRDIFRRGDTRLDQGNAKRGRSCQTAKDALAKGGGVLEDGHLEVIFKDLLGNIMEHAAVVALAESVGQGS